MHRHLFARVRRWLAAAWLAGGSALAPSAAQAANAILVDIQGTVRGTPEAVHFKGPVRIESRTVTDGTFGAAPNVELAIDMRGVVGVGAASGARYATHTREVFSTPLRFDGNGDIAIDFIYEGGSDKASPVSGVGHANFRLFFTPPAGALAIGRGWIATP